jgi:RNA polymerase sigma-70 factor (ECF subfamily)
VISGNGSEPSRGDPLTLRVLEGVRMQSLPDGLYDDIVDRFRGEIDAFFRRHGLSAEQAEDQTQEVFVKMVRALPTFRGQAALRTWVYRIAVNVLRDLLRRRQRSREVAWSDAFTGDDNADRPGRAVDQAATSLWGSAAPDPANAVARHELEESVRRAVAVLPAQQRVAMALQLKGLPATEIAAVMGKAPTAVRVLLSRARKSLRQPLAAIRSQWAPAAVDRGGEP